MPMATIVLIPAPLDRRSHQPLWRFAASSIAWRLGAPADNLAVRRGERDEQAAVVVERREEVADHGLHVPGSRPQLELLVQTAHAPLERKLDRVLLLLKSREPEGGDHVRAEHIPLAPAAQLENAATDCEDAAFLVAGDEAGRRRRVVVVHELEEEAEAAVMARDGFVEHPFLAVDVDRPLLAVRADEVRHGVRLARGSATPSSVRLPAWAPSARCRCAPRRRRGSVRRRGRPYSRCPRRSRPGGTRGPP